MHLKKVIPKKYAKLGLEQKKAQLKRQSHEIFGPWFFWQTTPLGSLIHGLKPF
jgi:hypothetical protein